MPEASEQIVQRLENLVRKVKVFSLGTQEVECRVLSPQGQGKPFVIEVHQDRFARRVSVDTPTLNRVMLGQSDPMLMRELRTAVLAVMRLAQRRARE